MKKLMITVVMMALVGVAGAIDLREIAFQTASPVKGKIMVDGMLDEEAWKHGDTNDRYYEYWIMNPKRVTNVGTANTILYDNDGLYLGFCNMEPLPEKLRRNTTKDNVESIWHDDSGEIYIDPNAAGIGYYKFVVNANGKYDPSWRMDTANYDPNWKAAGIQCAAKVLKDRWTLEMFIPWSAFHGRPAAKPGDVWTFCHVRYRWAERGWGDFMTSSPGGSYQNTGLFGYLYFVADEQPDTQRVLDVVNSRAQGLWAIQVGGKTYLHDVDGIKESAETIGEFISRAIAEDKAENALYTTNLTKIVTDMDFVAPQLPLKLAGSYSLEPPEEYDGHSGWARHNFSPSDVPAPAMKWVEKVERRPNVLFMTDIRGSIRDMLEFSNRYDLDCTIFPGAFQFSGPYEAKVTLGKLLDKSSQFETMLAKNPDVIFLDGFNFEHAPVKYIYEILRRVRDDGVGLVINGWTSRDFNTPFAKLPNDDVARRAVAQRVAGVELGLWASRGNFNAKDTESEAQMSFKHFGNGRVVRLSTGPLAWSTSWFSTFETRYALLWNVLRWAQGVDPQTEIGFEKLTRRRELLSTDARYLAVATKVVDGSANRLVYRVRDQRNRIVLSGVQKLDEGVNSTLLPVENLPGGDYFVDLAAQKTSFWPWATPKTDCIAVRAFTKAQPTGKIVIDGTNATSYVAENARARGVSITWENALAEPAVVRIEIEDRPHRQVRRVADIEVGMRARSANYRLDGKKFPTLSGVFCVKITGKNTGKVLGRADKLFYFPNHDFEDYPLISWCGVTSYGNCNLAELYYHDYCEEFGYLNHLEERGANTAVFNCRTVPYCARISIGAHKDGSTSWNARFPKGYEWLSQDGNIYRPEMKEYIQTNFAKTVARDAPYGVYCWSLGDECGFSYDCGFGPSDKVSFAKFLEGKYRNIATFNVAHGTKCASFAEAPHKSRKQAAEEGDWPAWFDQTQYCEKMYADAFLMHSEVIKKQDPKGRVGAEGSPGGDLEQTVAKLEFWGPYRSLVDDEFLRNIAPKCIRGIWWGGYVASARDGYPVEQWEYLLTGTLNCDLWFATRPGADESAFSGSLKLYPYAARMLPYLKTLRRGSAQMLVNTPMRDSGFAVYYSHASSHASFLDDRLAPPKESLAAYIHFCYRHGHDITMITKRTLKKLESKRVLFLCGDTALDDVECQAIRKFAENGGLVVADVTPALLDGYLAKRKANPLATLFGNTVLDTQGKFVVPDGKPMLNAVQVGKGEAILLGFPLADYAIVKGSKALDELMAEILAKRDIAERETLTGLPDDGKVLRIRELKYGEGKAMQIIGFKTYTMSIGLPVKLDFGSKGFVYEVDRGFVGETDAVVLDELEVPFKLYTVFGEEQVAPAFELSKTEITAGENVSFETKNLRLGSVYRMEVFGPDGKPIINREEIFTVDAKKPLARTFQFPYSDEPGEYTVVLRDIATALETAVKVEVK